MYGKQYNGDSAQPIQAAQTGKKSLYDKMPPTAAPYAASSS